MKNIDYGVLLEVNLFNQGSTRLQTCPELRGLEPWLELEGLESALYK